MNSMRFCSLSLLVLSLSMLLSPQCASAQFACGNCWFRVPTVTEYVNNAEILVVAKWVQAIPMTQTDPGATEFQIVTVIRQSDHEKGQSALEDRSLQSVNALHSGDRVGLRLHRTANPGDLFLISGWMKQDILQWGSPLEVTPASLSYCFEAPGSDAPAPDRIRYCARFIDSHDESIARDVFQVLGYASDKDLNEVGCDFPRLKLRKLLADTEITTDRRNTCLRLLGIYGCENDAKLLERYLFGKEDETSPDRREILIAYLLLKGERGLPMLEERLKDEDAHFADRNLALEAICHVARNTQRIPRDRLIESLRLPLEDMAFAETAIIELTNLKDWEIQDQLFGIFLHEDSSFRNTRLMIARYFLAAAADTGGGEDQKELPRRAQQAKQFLKAIEEAEPDLVEKANELAQIDVAAP